MHHNNYTDEHNDHDNNNNSNKTVTTLFLLHIYSSIAPWFANNMFFVFCWFTLLIYRLILSLFAYVILPSLPLTANIEFTLILENTKKLKRKTVEQSDFELTWWRNMCYAYRTADSNGISNHHIQQSL